MLKQLATKAPAANAPARNEPATRARPPLRSHALLELRVPFELGAYSVMWLPLLASTRKGDGHPVLVLPGFATGDATVKPLAMFLRSRGYAVETWGFGRNRGFNRNLTAALEQKLRYMHHHSGRKVSLVGWSLGGVFAFDLAQRVPECVRDVYSLGAPVTFSQGEVDVPAIVKTAYRWIAHPLGPVAHTAASRAKALGKPPSMPSACIYSETDGVVGPQAAQILEEGAQHENLQVPGTHVGLGFNTFVAWILADRLAQKEGHWRPFKPYGRLGWLYKQLI